MSKSCPVCGGVLDEFLQMFSHKKGCPYSARKVDMVNHPRHYNVHPSGVECIDIIEHMPFNRGAAIKHVWRAGEKGPAIEDLEKARWYLDREIRRLKGEEMKALALEELDDEDDG